MEDKKNHSKSEDIETDFKLFEEKLKKTNAKNAGEYGKYAERLMTDLKLPELIGNPRKTEEFYFLFAEFT